MNDLEKCINEVRKICKYQNEKIVIMTENYSCLQKKLILLHAAFCENKEPLVKKLSYDEYNDCLTAIERFNSWINLYASEEMTRYPDKIVALLEPMVKVVDLLGRE